jgi:hypothetical protein
LITVQAIIVAMQNAANTSDISTLSQKVQSIGHSSKWANNAYLILLALTLIASVVIVVLSNKRSDAQDELARAKDGELQKELKVKDGLIAAANKSAGDANERAAKLEKEAADARLELEKLKIRITEEVKNAPLKSRVSSASASVKLTVAPDVAKASRKPKRSSDGTIASLEVGKSTNWVIQGTETIGNGPWTLFLGSDHIEEWGNAEGSELFLQFKTLSFAPVDLAESVEELLKSVDMISFSMYSVPLGSEIRAGTITLTLNGNVKKTFPIPVHRTSLGGLHFLAPTDSAPIILTNKPVEIK